MTSDGPMLFAATVFFYMLHGTLPDSSCLLIQLLHQGLVSTAFGLQQFLRLDPAAEEQMRWQLFGRGQQRHHQWGALINNAAQGWTFLGGSGGGGGLYQEKPTSVVWHNDTVGKCAAVRSIHQRTYRGQRIECMCNSTEQDKLYFHWLHLLLHIFNH